MIGLLIRLLILALLFFIGYTLFHLLVGSGRTRPPQPPPGRKAGGEEMVQDALDGSYLPESLAVTARIDGKTLYFASTDNRDRYLQQRR